MTAADETPDDARCRVRYVLDSPSPMAGTRHTRCGLGVGHPGRHGPAPTQPDVAPASDGNAGGAGDEVSRLLLRSVRDFGTGFVWRHPGTGEDHVLNPVDVTVVIPSGQLTEIERLTGDLAEAIRERDHWHQTHDGVLHDLATANRERDEARARADGLEDTLRQQDESHHLRAKTDGGEWQTRHYGDAGQADRNVSWSTVDRPAYTHRRRVWIGPVETVTDDGGAA